MTMKQIKMIDALKSQGKLENTHFRVVYFGIQAEIKIIK